MSEVFKHGQRWHWRTDEGHTSLVAHDGYPSEKTARGGLAVAERRAAWTVYEHRGNETDDREPGWYATDGDQNLGPFHSEPDAAGAVENALGH